MALAGLDETRRWNLSVGTAYGFVWGLFFALFVWGYDALQLTLIHAEMPWAKLFLGLPVSLAVGTLLGFLSALISFGPVSALLGALAGGFLCWLAGHMPYEGGNLAAWLLHPDLWGVDIFPYGFAANVRMWLTVPVGVVLGAAAGYMQVWAVEWAWAGATARGRMGLRSWLVLLISVPFLLAVAAVVDTVVSGPWRAPQVRVADTIERVRTGVSPAQQDASYRSIKPFRDRLVGAYVTCLADYEVETSYFTYVDAVFESGLVLRCRVAGGEQVVYCEDFGKKAVGWMDDLIRAGRSGERRWQRQPIQTLEVEETVVAWLRDHAAEMEGDYQVEPLDRSGGCFRLAARFQSGFTLICRFRGGSPVVVEWCGG